MNERQLPLSQANTDEEKQQQTLHELVKQISEVFLVLLLADTILRPIAQGYNHMVLTASLINKLYHQRKINLN